MNVQNEWERKKTGRWTEGMWWELKRKQGVWLVGALCWWMRIWGIVCKPICSSVGEVVRSLSQGWGPESQKRKVRAASRAAESGSMRKKKDESRKRKQNSGKLLIYLRFVALTHLVYNKKVQVKSVWRELSLYMRVFKAVFRLCPF